MPLIDAKGFIVRRHGRKRGKGSSSKTQYRDWWIPKYYKDRDYAVIDIKYLRVPFNYIGKRIKLKIEIVEIDKND